MRTLNNASMYFPRYILPVMLGAVLAALLSQIWSLDTRHIIFIVIGITLASISMLFIARFSDFLLVSLFFSFPVAGFIKTLFVQGIDPDDYGTITYSGIIGVGVLDIILVGLYITWFIRIFVTRQDSIPKLEGIDGLVILLILAYVFSLWGVPDLKVGIFAVAYLLKYVSLYFYISRNLQARHIPWLIAALFFAILLEGILGILQNRTGMFLGLALDRGKGTEALDYQYSVPGIENFSRATGTTFDSHSLGLYIAMLIPYAFVLMYTRSFDIRSRVLGAGLFLVGVAVLIVTFSRAAWLSSMVSLFVVLAVYFIWRERHIIPSIFVMGLALLLLSPWTLVFVFERFNTAPMELLTARFEQWAIAFKIWLDNPVFGFGVGNYMNALYDYNENWAFELPVHNVLLWIAAETGLFGVFSFYGIVLAAMFRLWRVIRDHNDISCRIALAAFVGLIAYLLDGLTDPLFREPVVYSMFWLSIALSVAMPRIRDEEVAEKLKSQQ